MAHQSNRNMVGNGPSIRSALAARSIIRNPYDNNMSVLNQQDRSSDVRSTNTQAFGAPNSGHGMSISGMPNAQYAMTSDDNSISANGPMNFNNIKIDVLEKM